MLHWMDGISPFVDHVKHFGIIFHKRITWRLNREMIEVKVLRIFTTIYSLHKRDRSRNNIKLNIHKAVSQFWMFAFGFQPRQLGFEPRSNHASLWSTTRLSVYRFALPVIPPNLSHSSSINMRRCYNRSSCWVCFIPLKGRQKIIHKTPHRHHQGDNNRRAKNNVSRN
jgi:hypothetical protein